MRASYLLSLAALSACTSSSTVGSSAREAESVRIARGQGGELRMTSSAQTNVTRIAFHGQGMARATRGVGSLRRLRQQHVGENADSYDVYLTVFSQVEEDANGLAVLRTTFESMARPISFSREYSRCSSRGELERRLATAVMEQLMRQVTPLSPRASSG